MRSRHLFAASRPIIRICLAIGLSLALLSGSIHALVPQNPDPVPVYLAKDDGAWLDVWLPDAMARYQVPGAAVVLVRSGVVQALKGYGESNLATGGAIDVEQTVFHAAAFSQLLMAIAVLQLVDQGKLDMHTDINRYLNGLAILESNTEALTLAHLLTGSAGFAPRTIGTVLRRVGDVPSLQTALAELKPTKDTLPGQYIANSSYGLALAAAAIETASGQAYADYIETSILQPLGMRYTSTAQPLPTHVSAAVAQGYSLSGERLRPVSVNYDLLPAADGLYLSAADSAALVLAVLGDGVLGSERIYSTDQSRYLLEQQFQLAPGLPGVSLAFKELWMGQNRLLTLGSSDAGFTSEMLLWPSESFGLVMFYNSDNPALYDAFQVELLRRLGLEPQQNTVQPSRLAHEYAVQVRGYYRLEPAATGRERTRQLFRNEPSAELRVTTTSTGTFALKGGPAIWSQVTPGLFVDSSQRNWLRLRQAANGRISGLYLNQDSYQRIPWYRSLVWQRRFGMGLVALLLAGFVPLALSRRARARPSDGTIPLIPARMMAAISTLLLIVGFGMGALFGGNLPYGVSSALLVLQVLLVAAVTTGIVLLWLVVRLWRRRQGPLWFRVASGMYLRMMIAVVSFIQVMRIF